MQMLNVLAAAPSMTGPVWMVEFEAQLIGGRQAAATEAELESMVELIGQTAGVRSTAVVPRGPAVLAVAIALAAADAAAALGRARALVACGGRYAGLGEIAVRDARVRPEPWAGVA
jgi:hypothetical protein